MTLQGEEAARVLETINLNSRRRTFHVGTVSGLWGNISSETRSACYPDGVVLAPGDDPPGSRSQHRDWLMVSALHGARELAADHVLAAVTGGGGHAASPGGS